MSHHDQYCNHKPVIAVAVIWRLRQLRPMHEGVIICGFPVRANEPRAVNRGSAFFFPKHRFTPFQINWRAKNWKRDRKDRQADASWRHVTFVKCYRVFRRIIMSFRKTVYLIITKKSKNSLCFRVLWWIRFQQSQINPNDRYYLYSWTYLLSTY